MSSSGSNPFLLIRLRSGERLRGFSSCAGLNRLGLKRSVAVARFWVSRHEVAGAGVRSGASSFECPANIRLEPTRQRSCAILSPRCAAYLQR